MPKEDEVVTISIKRVMRWLIAGVLIGTVVLVHNLPSDLLLGFFALLLILRNVLFVD